MQLFGLLGETALPLTMGMFFNQYLAVGALSAMDLTVKEITISALILCICHELLVESAVVKRTRTAVWAFVLARFAFAFFGAFALNALWSAL